MCLYMTVSILFVWPPCISAVCSHYIIVLRISEFHSISFILVEIALFLSSLKCTCFHVWCAFAILCVTAFSRLPIMLISSPSIVPELWCLILPNGGGSAFCSLFLSLLRRCTLPHCMVKCLVSVIIS